MMSDRRHVLPVVTVLFMVLVGCGGNEGIPLPPTGPTPAVTASAYILPDAVSLGSLAFGDEAIVIYKNEHLRWVNLDSLTHHIVADAPAATDFRNTDELAPGGQQSFNMTRPGTTAIHCAIHPNMTGTLIVRER